MSLVSAVASSLRLSRRVSSANSTVSLDSHSIPEEEIDQLEQHSILSNFAGSSVADSVLRIFSTRNNDMPSVGSTSISNDNDNAHGNRSTMSRQSSIESIITSESRSRGPIYANRRGSRGLTSFLLDLDFGDMDEEMSGCYDSSSDSSEACDVTASDKRESSKTIGREEYAFVDEGRCRLAAEPQEKIDKKRQLFHNTGEKRLNSGRLDADCPSFHGTNKDRINEGKRSSFSAHRKLNSRAA